MGDKGKHMKRRVYLFAVTLILVVSLVPLSGVSAQRTAPAPASSASMSADPAPAARATYQKSIKAQKKMYCGGLICFMYKQKLTWQYDYSKIVYWAATMQGFIYQSGWYYYGYSLIGSAGGVGKTAYYRWTRGTFYSSTHGYYYLHVAMQVFYDGAYWKDKWYSTLN